MTAGGKSLTAGIFPSLLFSIFPVEAAKRLKSLIPDTLSGKNFALCAAAGTCRRAVIAAEKSYCKGILPVAVGGIGVAASAHNAKTFEQEGSEGCAQKNVR